MHEPRRTPAGLGRTGRAQTAGQGGVPRGWATVVTSGRSTLIGVAETSQTLDRGLRLLALLAKEPRGWTMTGLATAMGVNRTIVHRLVATLEQHRLARRDSSGLVHVGLATATLARGIEPLLRAQATPVLRVLADELGATAHLTVADGADALAVAVVEPSWTDFHVAYRVGSRHPLDRGAAGRAILLGRNGQPAAATPPYVTTRGELQSGAWGVAAPVTGLPDLVASVGVVSMAELDEERVGPRVARAAAQVSSLLG